MAKVHAHPLRELMFQLSVGRTPRQWAAACRPVLHPLLEASKQIGMLELVGALGAFDAALERAAGEADACIGDARGEALERAYARLREQMPDAFAPADASRQPTADPARVAAAAGAGAAPAHARASCTRRA